MITTTYRPEGGDGLCYDGEGGGGHHVLDACWLFAGTTAAGEGPLLIRLLPRASL